MILFQLIFISRRDELERKFKVFSSLQTTFDGCRRERSLLEDDDNHSPVYIPLIVIFSRLERLKSMNEERFTESL